MNFLSIQTFAAPDLGVYIAAQTVPKHNYHNPAKGVISTMNLGLQNIATARLSMEPAKWRVLKPWRILVKLQKRDPSMRHNLKTSIKPVLDLMSNHFSQMKCTGHLLNIE